AGEFQTLSTGRSRRRLRSGSLAAKLVIPDELFRLEAFNAYLAVEIGAGFAHPHDFVLRSPSVARNPQDIALADAFNLHQLSPPRGDFADARRTDFVRLIVW